MSTDASTEIKPRKTKTEDAELEVAAIETQTHRGDSREQEEEVKQTIMEQ